MKQLILVAVTALLALPAAAGGSGTTLPGADGPASRAPTIMQAAGVKVVYFESQGTAHEWQTWRRDLNDLAPRLFR